MIGRHYKYKLNVIVCRYNTTGQRHCVTQPVLVHTYTKVLWSILVDQSEPVAHPYAADEASDTARQANLRIHVERAFARVKKFRLFSRTVALHHVDMLGKLFWIVFMVSNNFALPLTNKDIDM